MLFAVFDDDKAIRTQELFLKDGLDEFLMETQMIGWVSKDEVVLNVFSIATIDHTIGFVDMHLLCNL